MNKFITPSLISNNKILDKIQSNLDMSKFERRESSFYLKNEFLYFAPEPTTNVKVAEFFFKPIEGGGGRKGEGFTKKERLYYNKVIPCCWDPSLYLIRDEGLYDILIRDEGDSSTGGVRPVRRDEGDSSTGGVKPVRRDEGDSSTGGVKPVRRDNGVVYGNNLVYNPDFQHTNTLKKLDKVDCGKLRKKLSGGINSDKTQIGIIDFGFGDDLHHADHIRYIINSRLGQLDNYQIHDYNILSFYEIGCIAGVCCQIARAIHEGIDILNISLGHYDQNVPQILENYIKKAKQAGIFIVTSAGNDGSNNDYISHWPSNFSKYISNVISKGALNKNNTDIHASSNCGNQNANNKTIDGYTKGHFNLADNYTIDGAPNGPLNDKWGTSFSAALHTAVIAEKFVKNFKISYIKSNGFKTDLLK